MHRVPCVACGIAQARHDRRRRAGGNGRRRARAICRRECLCEGRYAAAQNGSGDEEFRGLNWAQQPFAQFAQGKAAPLPTDLDHAPSTNRGILDYPHYTRPPSFRGWDVPEVLLSGNHEEIRQWRLQKAIEKTRRNRPELLRASELREQASRNS